MRDRAPGTGDDMENITVADLSGTHLGMHLVTGNLDGALVRVSHDTARTMVITTIELDVAEPADTPYGWHPVRRHATLPGATACRIESVDEWADAETRTQQEQRNRQG